MFSRSVLVAVLAASSLLCSLSRAQSTAFTYQGQLKDGVNLAEGQHDFRFRLFDAASSGTQLGTTQCVDNIQVRDGVFTTLIDFGSQFTTTAQRFIEIQVRRDVGQSCADTTGYTTLAPRQPITPAPTATQAASAFSLAAPDGSPAKAVFVSNDGNVGIGTTSPATSLDVQAPTSGPTPGAGVRIRGTSSGVANQAYMDFFNSVGTRIGYVGDGGGADNSIYLQSDSGNIALNTAVGTTLTATPSGNVGIGTTTPGAPLHIASRFAVLNLQDTGSNSTQAGYVSYRNGTGTETAWIGFGTAGNPDFSIVNARSGGDIILNAFSGSVGIGTATPDSRLTVASNSASFPAISGLSQDSTGISGITNAGLVGVYGSSKATAVYGYSTGTTSGTGVIGSTGSSGTNQVGVHGFCSGGDSNSYGVFATGRLGASGSKSFRIDHPDDPANRYLFHYSSESPEVINFYRGSVTLDRDGRALVQLPTYFAKVNERPSYQLTAVGAPMPMLHIAEKISERALAAGAASSPGDAPVVCFFRIAGGVPGGEVSWRVEARRNDPWMRVNGAPIELQKTGLEVGTYQHPGLYGQPAELGADVIRARRLAPASTSAKQ